MCVTPDRASPGARDRGGPIEQPVGDDQQQRQRGDKARDCLDADVIGRHADQARQHRKPDRRGGNLEADGVGRMPRPEASGVVATSDGKMGPDASPASIMPIDVHAAPA